MGVAESRSPNMSGEVLKERGDALENEFFARRNAKAAEALRAKLAAEESRDSLAKAAGIPDESVLDALEAAGITAESLAALALVPLVAVAWADGKLDDGEREAIIRAAEQAQVGDENRALLDGWLSAAPDAGLLEAWKGYVGSIRGAMEAGAYSALRERIVGGARQVAESAGGFLGLGNKVSASEAAVLEELEASFED